MTTLTGLFTLGRDAESRVTPSGATVVQLNAVYNYGRKGDDGKRPSQWIRLSMFGKQAEKLAPYLLKGKQVSLRVHDVHVNTFTKQDGSEAVSLEGIAEFDDFARGQSDGQPQRQAAPARQAPAPAPKQAGGFDDMDDDIPF